MKRIRESAPPRGLTRWLYRLPLGLYSIGLGGILGSRFLLLCHVGRKSGLPRGAVLEVVRHDPAQPVWIVSSGWGEASDWLKNLRAEPRVRIQVGRRKLAVRARILESTEAQEEILDYARRNPKALRGVARLVGLELDGSDADLRAFADVLRLVAFEPR